VRARWRGRFGEVMMQHQLEWVIGISWTLTWGCEGKIMIVLVKDRSEKPVF